MRYQHIEGLQMFYAKVSQLLQSKTGMNLFDFEVDSIKEPCWDNMGSLNGLGEQIKLFK